MRYGGRPPPSPPVPLPRPLWVSLCNPPKWISNQLECHSMSTTTSINSYHLDQLGIDCNSSSTYSVCSVCSTGYWTGPPHSPDDSWSSFVGRNNLNFNDKLVSIRLAWHCLSVWPADRPTDAYDTDPPWMNTRIWMNSSFLPPAPKISSLCGPTLGMCPQGPLHQQTDSEPQNQLFPRCFA